MAKDTIVDTGIRRPMASIGRRFAFGLGAFSIGALVAVYLFPIDMLLDRWAWWGRVQGDNATGLIGYLYFAQDQWRWPLFYTQLLDPPHGVNIVYTDPVPIAALIGKAVFKMTGFLQIYMGGWILLSYGLQSLTSWLIFRQIGLRPAPAMIAAAMISLTPAFIFRFPHIGLVAHFIILSAILIYLRMVTIATKREMAVGAAATGAILLVNPYLLAMSATIFIAGLLEALWRKRILWQEAAVLVVLMGTVAGGLSFAFGIIGQGGLPSTAGFGVFSMNLLSPVVPQFSAVPGHETFLLNKTGGQYEGFNYLGAGALLLLFCALALKFRTVKELATRHRFLVIALICLTVFAASSSIYVGNWHVVDLGYENLPLLNFITSVFRSSGRFFWPVGYVVVIGAIAVLAKSTSRRLFVPLIAGALVIQLIDVTPLLNYARASNLPHADRIDRALWARALATHSEVTIYPDYYCIDQSYYGFVMQLQLLAARAQIPANAAYVNRKQPNCSDQRHWTRLDAASVTQNPLVVLFKDGFPTQILETDAAAGFFCRDASFAFVCSRQGNNPAFIALGGKFEAPSIPLGVPLTVGQGGTGVPFLGLGWSHPEGNSRGADGNRISLIGRLEQLACNTLSFSASVVPFIYGDYMVREAKLVLNGEAAGEITLAGTQSQVIKGSIALEGRCIDSIDLELQFANVQSPKELGINTDTRRLSWTFNWFSIEGN